MKVVMTIIELRRMAVKGFINVFLIIINSEVDTGGIVKKFV